jgi:hypothetical protein
LVATFTRGRDATKIREIVIPAVNSFANWHLVKRLGGARQMKAIGPNKKMATIFTDHGASHCTDRNRHQTAPLLSDLGAR